MARKPRIHIPGGFYHVILRGNDSQDIFFSDQDRYYFENLVQDGIDKFKHRIHAYCWMRNHVHMLIQVGEVPLSKIVQNSSFRYTNYINKKMSRTGHLFQGRYKAILIDEESYLLELVRYIHLNPVRAKTCKIPEDYEWSGHLCYLGRKINNWLTTEYVISQFSDRQDTARLKYEEFILEALDHVYKHAFHYGSAEGRLLGDDNFIEEVLRKADKREEKKFKIEGMIDVLCKSFRVKREELISRSRRRSLTRVRSIIAYMAAEHADSTLSDYARIVKRDLSTLSIAASQIREELERNSGLRKRIKDMISELENK